MGFLDYAWDRCVKISRKDPAEIRIYTSKAKYPVLSGDQHGFIIHLPEPGKMKGGLWSFEGMIFEDTPEGRNSLWRIFQATVDHLSLHLAYSDLSTYSKWSDGRDLELATFVVSLVEDSLIQARSAAMLNILRNQAYVNVMSYLKLKHPRYIWSPSMKIQSAILSKLTVGVVDGLVQEDMAESVDKISARLKSLEESILHEKPSNEELCRLRVEAAEDIYGELERYGEPPEAAALPYRENHGGSRIFLDVCRNISKAEFEHLLDQAIRFLGLTETMSGSVSRYSESSLDVDADSVFSRWESRAALRKRILDSYSELACDTHFDAVVFPKGDYGRYLRTRSELAGPIRRIADQVRLVKNQEDEIYRAEVGMVDLQEAIQLIASRSVRSDIFIREEPLKKNESWSILVDLSGSMGGMALETKSSAICMAEAAAICLAEVTNAMLSKGEPWGLYGFGGRFYVVKDFLEDYSLHIKARLGGIRPSGLTYLPDAVKITSKIIKAYSGDSRSFILIVSDGLPTGYSGIEEELEEVLYDVERSGVIPLAVGMNTKRIKRFFRHYCVVSSPYDLMKSFIRSYLELSSLIQG